MHGALRTSELQQFDDRNVQVNAICSAHFVLSCISTLTIQTGLTADLVGVVRLVMLLTLQLLEF